MAGRWQEELVGECRNRGFTAPVYNIVSDRRGGRTAWSATVTVQNQNIAARYWYDGQYLNNAKEDAAEVGCTRLRNPAITTASAGSARRNWDNGAAAAEEEKEEPPEGALHALKESHLEQATTHTMESAEAQIATEPKIPELFD